jgi:hypothetical protein
MGHGTMTITLLDTDLDTELAARVSFRQPVESTGSVDGGWWPRSTDLAAEIVPLLDVLWTAGREMRRVSYNLDSWDKTPRRIVIEGHLVHLGGYSRQSARVLSVSDARHGDTADLLIIPFDTEPALAHRLLEVASEPGNLRTPDQMDEATR